MTVGTMLLTIAALQEMAVTLVVDNARRPERSLSAEAPLCVLRRRKKRKSKQKTMIGSRWSTETTTAVRVGSLTSLLGATKTQNCSSSLQSYSNLLRKPVRKNSVDDILLFESSELLYDMEQSLSSHSTHDCSPTSRMPVRRVSKDFGMECLLLHDSSTHERGSSFPTKPRRRPSHEDTVMKPHLLVAAKARLLNDDDGGSWSSIDSFQGDDNASICSSE